MNKRWDEEEKKNQEKEGRNLKQRRIEVKEGMMVTQQQQGPCQEQRAGVQEWL